MPIFILDPQFYFDAKTWYFKFPRQSDLKNKFLYESLTNLRGSLLASNSDLVVFKGKTESVILALVQQLKANYILKIVTQTESTYEEDKLESQIEAICLQNDISFQSVWGSTLVERERLNDIPKQFTQFRKHVESDFQVKALVKTIIPAFPNVVPDSACLLPGYKFGAIPMSNTKLDSRSVYATYFGGETEALRRLDDYFFKFDLLKNYKDTRNGLIGSNYSSKFSAYLALGCISPRYIYHKVQEYELKVKNKSTYWVIFELLWRDFFKFIAIDLKTDLFKIGGPNKYEKEWSTDLKLFDKWAKGETGIPFVDANMKELLLTGYMSNRGRQNVASFLTKDLNLDWRLGAEWFESHLIDHDVCSNYGNWIYASGVALDPRKDRKFNMIKQAKDYDPAGEYIRLWIPELATVEHVFYPWVHTDSLYFPPVCVAPEWTKYMQNRVHKRKPFTIKDKK